MKKSILLFFILIGASSLFAQQKGKVMTIDLKVIDGKGFTGTIDFVYGFNDCFGDAQMLYTYKNIKITKFFYNNKAYSASDLGITSFDEYLLSPDITVNVMRPLDYFKSGEPRYGGTAGGMQSSVKGNIQLKGVLEQQLAGCLGQTHKLGKAEKAKIDNYNLSLPLSSGLDIRHLYLDKSKSKAYLNFSTTLVDLIKCADDPKSCEEKENDNKVVGQNTEYHYYVFRWWQIRTECRLTSGSISNSGNREYLVVFKSKCQYNVDNIRESVKNHIIEVINNSSWTNGDSKYCSEPWLVLESLDYKCSNCENGFHNEIIEISELGYSNMLNALKKGVDFEIPYGDGVVRSFLYYYGNGEDVKFIRMESENIYSASLPYYTAIFDYSLTFPCQYEQKETKQTPKPQNQETKPTEKKKSYWD